MRPIHIVGAGLAGLALGCKLRMASLPVTLSEAGRLPRHRVCGEFMSGRGAEVLERLGLQEVLIPAAHNRNVHWFRRGKNVFQHELPTAALGLSRYYLDYALARRFRDLGGELRENSRIERDTLREGRVRAHGRKVDGSAWLGLKAHVRGLALNADLELHLGEQAYVGISRVENNRVNVCGLFRKRPGVKAPPTHLLPAYLDNCGLGGVARRLREATLDPESRAAVAGIRFARQPPGKPGLVSLGDAYSSMPPFTGNGMSVALESAELAAPALLAYSHKRLDWMAAAAAIQRNCARHFNRRLRIARFLHPWISESRRSNLLVLLARARLLPFRHIYNATR